MIRHLTSDERWISERARALSAEEIKAAFILENGKYLMQRSLAEFKAAKSVLSREARAGVKERKRLRDVRYCANLERWV